MYEREFDETGILVYLCCAMGPRLVGPPAPRPLVVQGKLVDCARPDVPLGRGYALHVGEMGNPTHGSCHTGQEGAQLLLNVF